jgi:hypothetical protein
LAEVERRLMPSSVVDPEQRFEVTVEAVQRGMSARLVVRDARGAASERVVEAENCGDVFETLAFIVAMTIDPNTAAQPASEFPSAPPASETTAEPAVNPALDGAKREQPNAAAPIVSSASAQRSDKPAKAPSSERSSTRDLSFELGGLVEGTTAVAPGVTPAARLFGTVRWPSVGFVYPSLRLSAARSTEQTVPVDAERGGLLTWTAARLELCATSAFHTSKLLVDLCPATDIGVLDGEGYGDKPTHERPRTWWSLDLLARFGFLAGEHVLLVAESGLVVPVTRDRFTLSGPEAEVFQAPRVALTFGGGAALELP